MNKRQAQADGDLISRQDVLDLIEDMTDQFGVRHRVITEGVIELLPSVKPQEPKTGRWNLYHEGYYDESYVCSECDGDSPFDYKYCPNCGCHMVEPQESEDKNV